MRNYWQNFRILAEDLANMRFYIHIDNTTETNTFSCFDKHYDFQVTRRGCQDHNELQDTILFQFVFRNP